MLRAAWMLHRCTSIDRQGDGADGVVDGDRGVRIGAGIDDDGVAVVPRLLDPGDQFAFVVGLAASRRSSPSFLPSALAHRLDIGERLRAIDVRARGCRAY